MYPGQAQKHGWSMEEEVVEDGEVMAGTLAEIQRCLLVFQQHLRARLSRSLIEIRPPESCRNSRPLHTHTS